MTLHDLIEDLTKTLNLTPEQQFQVTAKVKRLIHHEKANVYSRLAFYGELPNNEIRDKFVHDVCIEKAQQHQDMADNFKDEELVTWSVGSHVYVQAKPPCAVCGADLMKPRTSYMGIWENEKGYNYYCKSCAEAKGIWEEFEDFKLKGEEE